MDHDRRNFLSLSTFMPIVAAIPLGVLVSPAPARAQSGGQQSPRMLPFPDKTDDPAPELSMSPAAAKGVLQHNQLEMKQAIQKLYALVEQLKEQVDRTDSTSVLSLNLIDSAKKVEDLAKQIRNLARN